MTDDLDYSDEPTVRLVVTRASEIEPEAVQWLWPGRFPLGKTVLIAGLGGVGKSLLWCKIVAVVTQGGAWPQGEGRAVQGSVVAMAAEDDAADTLIPRLMAAGADLDRVHIVPEVRVDGAPSTFNLERDLGRLEDLVKQIGDVKLVVIRFSEVFDRRWSMAIRSAARPAR